MAMLLACIRHVQANTSRIPRTSLEVIQQAGIGMLNCCWLCLDMSALAMCTPGLATTSTLSEPAPARQA